MSTRAGEVLNSVYDGETNSLRVKNLGSEIVPPDPTPTPTTRVVHAAYRTGGGFGKILMEVDDSITTMVIDRS